MIDLNEIEDTIKDLENKPTTLDNCKILADMLIIEHFYKAHKNDVETELNDILPQYRRYREIKRKYQLQEVTESAVINAMNKVCKEICEFINTLYSCTDMPEEREQLQNLIQNLSSTFNN